MKENDFELKYLNFILSTYKVTGILTASFRIKQSKKHAIVSNDKLTV
jgi:hypothetical protein